MTLQERKLQLISQLTFTENKNVIKEIELLLKKAKIEEYEKSLKPMSKKEFIAKINEAEEDIKHGRVYTQKEVEQYFKNKFK